MSIDLTRDRQVFEDAQEGLTEPCERLEEWLIEATRELGIDAIISARVKEVTSFLRKVLKKHLKDEPYGDPLAEMSDKIGVRADVLTIAHRDQVCRRIRSESDMFTVLVEEDMLEDLGVAGLGYQGVHFDVRPTVAEGTAGDASRAEIQVRTATQSAWAQISHDLAYKVPPTLVPKTDQRRLNRLTALVELFDEEVERTRTSLLDNPEYPIGRVLDALDGALLRVRGEHADFDGELSRYVVGVLLADTPASEYGGVELAIPAFVQDHEKKLRATYDHYRGSDRHLLLFQPEALLIFMQLETGRHALKRRWDESLPPEELERLALVWGTTTGS